jgi:UDP-N-acetyl-D-glucosamine dehydrogenase
MDLLSRIDKAEAKIGIVGLGYVGLPLAMEFVRGGFEVHGIEVDPEKTAQINQGKSHVLDVPDSVLASAVDSGAFVAHAGYDIVSELDCVSICVPTPLRKTKDPDISYILSATRNIRRYLHRGMLIILESTTYPGTTDEVLVPELLVEGLELGKDVYVAFSPERVDPGNPVYNTNNTPKILGGATPRCTKVATRLYEKVIERVIPVSSTASAEMVKLLENTFRAVNIGLVNEIAIMCDRLNLSVWEVIEAAATKPFGFMPFFPGPGLGGHCIPIDPLYLSWKLKTLNYNARFIELASEINSLMPEYCVFKITGILNKNRKCVNGSKILVIGVAYKKDVSDTRESPALDIIRLLELAGATVDYSDPYVPELESEGSPKRSVPLDAERLGKYDLVVLVTDHTCFDYELIQDAAPVVFDTRNALKRSSENVVKL